MRAQTAARERDWPLLRALERGATRRRLQAGTTTRAELTGEGGTSRALPDQGVRATRGARTRQGWLATAWTSTPPILQRERGADSRGREAGRRRGDAHDAVARGLMRRTQLKRKAWPKSRTRPMRRTEPKVTDDPAYLARVRLLPCAAIGMVEFRVPCVFAKGWTNHRCGGAVRAHHSLTHRRGKLKALDRNTIPVCDRAHRSVHNPIQSGPLKGFSKAQRRDWERTRVAETQAALEVGGGIA